MKLTTAIIGLVGSIIAVPPLRVDCIETPAGPQEAASARPSRASEREEVGSGWTGCAREYLDTYREYFFGSRGNSAKDLERLRKVRAKLQAAAPPADELHGALVSGNAHIAIEAVAAVAVSDAPESRLLERILDLYPREPDPAVRQLALNALSRGSEWVRLHGDRVVTALATERHASPLVVAALDVVALLDTDDLLRATSALVQNGDAASRKVLYGSLDLREGRAGLQALAKQLRQVGRHDLAAEVERSRSKAK